MLSALGITQPWIKVRNAFTTATSKGSKQADFGPLLLDQIHLAEEVLYLHPEKENGMPSEDPWVTGT